MCGTAETFLVGRSSSVESHFAMAFRRGCGDNEFEFEDACAK